MGLVGGRFWKADVSDGTRSPLDYSSQPRDVDGDQFDLARWRSARFDVEPEKPGDHPSAGMVARPDQRWHDELHAALG